MKLNKDLREFIALLNSTGVRYLIVGGYAVAFHGYPRFTGDMDFFVERSPENAVLLEQVLENFTNRHEWDWPRAAIASSSRRPRSDETRSPAAAKRLEEARFYSCSFAIRG